MQLPETLYYLIMTASRARYAMVMKLVGPPRTVGNICRFLSDGTAAPV